MDNFTEKWTIYEGQTSRVVLVFDNNIKREVVIKELASDLPEKNRVENRFFREARITGQLEHPGVVPVYELKTKDDGTPYYVMKYVNGETLYHKIQSCRSHDPADSYRKRMQLFNNLIAAAEAISYAHSKGVVHRDIKPGNIIIGEFGETIVLDWGLAKLVNEHTTSNVDLNAIHDDDPDTMLTRHDQILGTPSYMSPEQIDSDKFGNVSIKTDVYSLGVVLYMLLTGAKPYSGSAKDVLKQIVSPEPSPSPKVFGEHISAEIAAICEKAMSKNPGDRFEDAAEMVKELKAVRDGKMLTIYSYSKSELFRRFVQRNKLALLATGGVILSIIIGAAFALHFAYIANFQKQKVEHALRDLPALSESTALLVEDVSLDIEKYISKLQKDFETMSEDELKKIYPKLKFSTKAPENVDGSELQLAHKGIFGTIILSDLIEAAMPLDPRKSDYHFWCMKEDGQIIYDEDPKQIGLNLFTDEMYQKFPELLKFGKAVKERHWGIGQYVFTVAGGDTLMYKIAAWETVEKFNWKIIATYPYVPHQGE